MCCCCCFFDCFNSKYTVREEADNEAAITEFGVIHFYKLNADALRTLRLCPHYLFVGM